jgi:hypothetical protein
VRVEFFYRPPPRGSNRTFLLLLNPRTGHYSHFLASSATLTSPASSRYGLRLPLHRIMIAALGDDEGQALIEGGRFSGIQVSEQAHIHTFTHSQLRRTVSGWAQIIATTEPQDDEPFLRSHPSLSYQGISQQFMEPEGSLHIHPTRQWSVSSAR